MVSAFLSRSVGWNRNGGDVRRCLDCLCCLPLTCYARFFESRDAGDGVTGDCVSSPYDIVRRVTRWEGVEIRQRFMYGLRLRCSEIVYVSIGFDTAFYRISFLDRGVYDTDTKKHHKYIICYIVLPFLPLYVFCRVLLHVIFFLLVFLLVRVRLMHGDLHSEMRFWLFGYCREISGLLLLVTSFYCWRVVAGIFLVRD